MGRWPPPAGAPWPLTAAGAEGKEDAGDVCTELGAREARVLVRTGVAAEFNFLPAFLSRHFLKLHGKGAVSEKSRKPKLCNVAALPGEETRPVFRGNSGQDSVNTALKWEPLDGCAYRQLSVAWTTTVTQQSPTDAGHQPHVICSRGPPHATLTKGLF